MSGFRTRVGVGVGFDVGQRRGVPEPGTDAIPQLIGFDGPIGGCGVEGGVIVGSVGGGGSGVVRGKSRYGIFD